MFNAKYEIVDFLKKKNFQKRIDKLSKKYTGKKIMIYGAGRAFEAINENYDLSGLDIIGIADMKFEQGREFMGYKTYEYDTFPGEKPDVVLIAMVEHEIAEEFFSEELVPEYGNFNYEPMIKLSLLDLIKKLFQ